MSEPLQHQLNEAIESSAASLAKMRESILAKKWDRLADAEDELKHSLGVLENLCNSKRDEFLQLEGYVDKFKQLSLMQRRVMRLLSTQMQTAREDIDSLGQGVRRLRQVSESFSES